MTIESIVIVYGFVELPKATTSLESMACSNFGYPKTTIPMVQCSDSGMGGPEKVMWKWIIMEGPAKNILVGGLEHVLFLHILGIVTPTD